MELSPYEYNQLLEKLARDATESRIKLNKKIGWKEFKVKKEDRFNKRKPAEQAYFEDYLRRIKKAYPYETLTDEQVGDIEAFSGDNALQWLDFGGMSPSEFAKSIEAAKFLPLLQGRSDDPNEKNWYNMGNEELKKNAVDIGWDPRTKEGFAEFLDKVAEYQRYYDRAKLTKELRDKWYFGPTSLLFPSAVGEIENAVATGEGGDAGTVAGLTGVDVLANSLTFGAPGLRATRNMNPLLYPVTKGNAIATMIGDAAVQGIAEAGRQGAKQGLSETGQEFEVLPVIASTSMGASRPAIVGSVQGVANQFEGPFMKDFAKGVSMATRKGNPVIAEREGVVQNIANFSKINMAETAKEEARHAAKKAEFQDIILNKQYNKVMADPNVPGSFKRDLKYFKEHDGQMRPVERPMSTTEFETGVRANVVPDYLKLFKLNASDLGKIPEYYDMPTKVLREVTPGNKIIVHPNGGIRVRNGFVELDKDARDMYMRLFPQKYAMDAGDNAARRAGLRTGQFFGSLGNRVEPTIKANPVTPITNWVNGVSNDDGYKNEEWYKKLSKESKKIIDEAFKKKEEEE